MPSLDLNESQIEELIGQRHARTGIEYPLAGLQPYHHWLIRTLYRLAEASTADFRVCTDSTSPSSVHVAPGRASISGVAIALAETTVDLSSLNNSTALIWLEDDSGSSKIDFAASSTGWPATPHIKLAEVTLAAGQISSVVDRRAETIFRV